MNDTHDTRYPELVLGTTEPYLTPQPTKRKRAIANRLRLALRLDYGVTFDNLSNDTASDEDIIGTPDLLETAACRIPQCVAKMTKGINGITGVFACVMNDLERAWKYNSVERFIAAVGRGTVDTRTQYILRVLQTDRIP